LDFSGMADLFDVRKKFLANLHTIKNVRQDFQHWHHGRLRYAFWAIDVDFPAVRQQVLAATQHLEKFLLQGYCRQLHITLGICGFIANKPLHADDYVASNFAAHLEALRHLHINPFEIEIGALASFSSAPFLHVSDNSNNLQKLHACLHALASDAHFQYVPHVTIGLYSESWSTKIVGNHLDNFPPDFVTSCLIKKISLMSYMAAEIGGKLVTIADYDLASAEIHWHEPPPFNHAP
jgi:2'-5' RNA ligase